MIKTADLFSIAKTGVNASGRLLSTTSNNIANINTEGYVRERTEFKSELTGGVNIGFTDRVLNQFAMNQLRRDITSVGEAQAFFDRAEGLDNVLASEANSISGAITRFFASVQTAADDATNITSRDSVLGQAQGLVNRINTLGDFMTVKEREVEQQIDDSVNNANALIGQIGNLNKAIQVIGNSSNVDTPSALMNERDLAIRKLAEFMSIETRTSPNSDLGLVVNLTSGESLVLADGTFNVLALDGEPDFTSAQLRLSTNYAPPKANTTLNVQEEKMGGALGGLFRYREQILEPAQRDLGKLSTALADAFNSQNRQGMDLDQQLGGNIFELPGFRGINYPDNSDLSLGVKGRFTEGAGGDITNSDYQLEVLTSPTGSPPTFDVQVSALNSDGTAQLDESGTPITQVLNVSAQAGTYNAMMGGIEIEFASGAAYGVGDQFLFQPLRKAANDLSLATTRGEDLAFAKPLRVDTNAANLGDATIRSVTVSNTTIDNSFGNIQASGFNGAGGIQSASETPATVGAPASVLFTSATEFQVLDNAVPPNIITTVSGVTDMNNLLQQAKDNGASPPWPTEFAALQDYPGYDFSLEGIPKPGDSFDISFNTNGLADNRNAVELAGLQQEDTVRQSIGSNGNKATFNETYANIVGSIGAQTANGKIELAASQVLQTQSADWFESTSGVSLDEEAANLIQFQQSYAAAARILTTAQELFNTILSAAR
ncbi:MAG: flagellar hook-associated protein 1 FlgK [Glaciecola sp.]|jgi:flagellar hook-associated protein 1 FlgK